MKYLPLVLFLACGTASSMDGGADAGNAGGGTGGGSGADAGMTDALSGVWHLSGTVTFGGANTYRFETPITLTRASDGNYRLQSAGCTIPYETESSTALRSVETTCTFSETDLTATKINGFTPGFGDSVTMRFEGDAGIRLVADVFTATGGIVNTRFPDAPGTYSFNGTR